MYCDVQYHVDSFEMLPPYGTGTYPTFATTNLTAFQYRLMTWPWGKRLFLIT